MICPNCHTEIAQGKKFCGTCGSPLSASTSVPDHATLRPLHCPKCASEVSPGKKFCGVCGSPVEARQAGSSVAPGRPGLISSQGSRPTTSPPPQPAATAQSAGSSPPFPKSSPSDKEIGPRVDNSPKRVVSTKTLTVAATATALLLCAVGWYMWGVELDLTTEPGGAEVVLDGKPLRTPSNQAGVLVLPHLTHGTHTLRLTHPGFGDWSQSVDLGYFEVSHPLRAALPVPSFPLTVLTNPAGAKVQLDSQDAGTTGAEGSLVIQNVARGQHRLTVSLGGYPSRSSTVWIEEPLSIRLDLVDTAVPSESGGQRGSEPADTNPSRSTAEVEQWLSRAENQFQQADYRSAVQSCDAALRIEPSNAKATQLKAKIEETMKILGKN